MDWIVSKQKADFVGKRSLSRRDTIRPDRKQLVGLLPDDKAMVLPEGAQLLETSRGVQTIGHVTSSYWSSTLERAFALALVKDGRRRIGGDIFARLEHRAVPAKVVAPIFFDKEGLRQHA